MEKIYSNSLSSQSNFLVVLDLDVLVMDLCILGLIEDFQRGMT